MSQPQQIRHDCTPGEIPAQKVRTALALLVEARKYARDTQCDRWEFAVEINAFRAGGLSRNDLRWLLRKGYVEHARETTTAASVSRQFQRLSNHTFFKRSCFVLTDAGSDFANQIGEGVSSSEDLPQTFGQVSHNGNGRSRPKWDAELRELHWNGVLVKRFRVPSPNQELVLATFEEQGWPCRIDDPLPPKFPTDQKRRLNDTVRSLNHGQCQRLIRFLGDGRGQGIRWELFQHSSPSSENP